MILFSAKKSAVHDMHLTALAHYAQTCGLDIGPHLSGLSAIRPMMASSHKVMFSQSTGVANLLVMPLARMSGKRIVHYMHEPTSFRHKRMNTPFIKSIAMHMVQWVEMRVAQRMLVSRSEMIEQAVDFFGASPGKFTLAPLVLPEVRLSGQTTRNRVTYLGRIDEHRYFSEFLEQVPVMAARGLIPTILTGDVTTFERYKSALPKELEVFAERNFSEELKKRVVSETLCLWNPKRGAISQSGVTADAVRHGVAILLTDKDPAFDTLSEAGIALDFPSAMDSEFATLDDIDPAAVQTAAVAQFSEQHGLQAFKRHYLPELT